MNNKFNTVAGITHSSALNRVRTLTYNVSTFKRAWTESPIDHTSAEGIKRLSFAEENVVWTEKLVQFTLVMETILIYLCLMGNILDHQYGDRKTEFKVCAKVSKGKMLFGVFCSRSLHLIQMHDRVNANVYQLLVLFLHSFQPAIFMQEKKQFLEVKNTEIMEWQPKVLI